MNTPKWEFSSHITCNLVLPHNSFPWDGVIGQEMQAQMLHSFPFPGLKVISWKFLPFQDLRVLCTSPLESISRAYSMSGFLCNRCIHIETNMEFSFVCFLVFGLLLFSPPFAALFFSAVLVGKLFYRKQEFQLHRLFWNSNQTFQKTPNLMSLEVLPCQVANCRISQMSCIGSLLRGLGFNLCNCF